MKKSKILLSVLIVLICGLVSMLSACEFDKPAEHTNHTWTTTWTTDNEYHWYKCTGCTEVKDKAKHSYTNGVCICGKVVPETATDSNGIKYQLNISKTAYIAKEIGSASNKSEITIPETINGLPVDTIGENLFYNDNSLTKISLPNSIRVVEWGAFSGCNNLQFSTYEECSYLGNASNPYMVVIGYNNNEIVDVKLHANTKVVADYAFWQQTIGTITSVELPNGLLSIGEWAFNGVKITQLDIPDSVINIGKEAFNQCRQLATLKLSNGLTTLGNRVFAGCNSLTEVIIPNSVTVIEDGCFHTCQKLTKVTFSDNLTSIGNDAFKMCFNLVGTLTLPEKLEKIGNNCFDTVNKITAIEFKGSNLKSLGESCFSGCKKVTKITFAGTISQWDNVEKMENWNQNMTATIICSDTIE